MDFCICCDIREEKKIKHPWEEDHRRHDWVTMLRKCVCKCSKGEVWPSALNQTDSVCGVSLGMILDYGCNNPIPPLGNMLIAQIGIFFPLHTAGPRRISQTLSAFQTLIIGFGYWIWCSAPAARIPNLGFLEQGWFALGHKCIGQASELLLLSLGLKEQFMQKWTLCHHLLTHMLFQMRFYFIHST